MKKMMMALVAVMTMSANVMAQENNEQQVEQQQVEQRQRQRPDRTEMVKRYTDQMVEKYQLDETQATQLLELNTRYAEKMGPMMMGRGNRGPRDRRPAGGMMPRERRNIPAEGDTLNNHQPEQRGANRYEEMRKNMEAYEKELQEIMNEEQFEAYKKDTEQMRQQQMNRRGPRGERGQRGERGPRGERQ